MTPILKAICLFVSGLAIGWLMGLSISPVIQVVLTSVVAVVVAFSSALAGLSHNKPEGVEQANQKSLMVRAFNPLPIMCMVLGLAVGSSAGVYARSHNWFGVSGPSLTSQWKETGLSEQEIARRMFDSAYPPVVDDPKTVDDKSGSQAQTPAGVGPNKSSAAARPNTLSAEGETSKQRAEAGVLFTEKLNQCRRLLNVDNADSLRREMASSSFPELVQLARDCKDLQCLVSGVTKSCASYR